MKFKNQPIYKDKLFGLSKVYSHSDVKYDKISTLIEVEEDKGGKLVNGFCIRTGVNIPFDISNPFSKEAYKSWSQFKNETYPEKFCHYSGEKSNGETCFKTPVLRKYYAESKRG